MNFSQNKRRPGFLALTAAAIVLGVGAAGGLGSAAARAQAAAPTAGATSGPIIDLEQRRANKVELLKLVAGEFTEGCRTNTDGVIAQGGGPIVVTPGSASGLGLRFDPLAPMSTQFSLTRTADNLQMLVQVPVAGAPKFGLRADAAAHGQVVLATGKSLIVCNGKPNESSGTDLFALFRKNLPSLPFTMKRCHDALAHKAVYPVVVIEPRSVTVGSSTFNLPAQKTESLHVEDSASEIRQSGSFKYSAVVNSFFLVLALDDGNNLRQVIVKSADGTEFISCRM
jgi:hypothetical protein